MSELAREVEPGEIVDVGMLGAADSVRIPVQVRRSCGGREGQWICLTHQRFFRDRLTAFIHEQAQESHLMAWYCSEHGVEQP